MKKCILFIAMILSCTMSYIYIQNENYALVREMIGNNIYIGSEVTTTKPFGNVTIKSEAELNVDAKGKTILNKGTLIEKGAKVYIK